MWTSQPATRAEASMPYFCAQASAVYEVDSYERETAFETTPAYW